MGTTSAAWTLIASSARLQRSSQTLSIIGNRVLIFGGELLARQPVDNRIDLIELGNEEQGSGSNIQILSSPHEAPSQRVGAAATVVSRMLYLFSGRGGPAMSPIEEHGGVWTYGSSNQGDPASWSLLKPADSSAPYPAGRSYHAMASNGIDTIYVHAGCPETGRLSDLWAFNTSTKAWKELAHAPDPRRGGTSIAFSHGALYRMNGFDGSTEQGGSLDVYDIESNAWSTIGYQADGTNGPQPRSVSALAAMKIGGRPSLVTLFGEGQPSRLGHAGAGRMFGDVWIFDIEGQSWSKAVSAGDSPVARGWFAADVAVNDTGREILVVHGGLAEDNSRLGDVWKLELD